MNALIEQLTALRLHGMSQCAQVGRAETGLSLQLITTGSI